jgi:predicted small secreted protein
MRSIRKFDRDTFNEEHIMLKRLIFAIAAGSIALTAAACNTVKGAGRDIESVGDAGADAID